MEGRRIRQVNLHGRAGRLVNSLVQDARRAPVEVGVPRIHRRDGMSAHTQGLGAVSSLPRAQVRVASIVVPSRKLTDPAGVPPDDLTVAVKVTVAPHVEGLSDDVTAVVLAALFTTCDRALEVLPVKLLSPA